MDLPDGRASAPASAARPPQLVQLARDAALRPAAAGRCPRRARVRQEVFDEAPRADAWRLLFVIKRRLHPLLESLSHRLRAVACCTSTSPWPTARSTRLREVLRPAAPTLDAVLLMELVRLRLERLTLDAAGSSAWTSPWSDADAPAAGSSTSSVASRRRDPAAAARAAGPGARRAGRRGRGARGAGAGPAARAGLAVAAGDRVGHAATDATSPGGSSAGATGAGAAAAAHGGAGGPGPHGRRAAAARAPPVPAVRRWCGTRCAATVPILSRRGWWCGEERRVYHFVEDADGAILWVFFSRGRWFLQGRVE